MSKELANVEDDRTVAVDIMSCLCSYTNTDGKIEISTFDPSTEEGAEMLILATIADIKDLSELANLTINVRHFLMHEASRVYPSGEVDTWQRIVIINDKGEAYSCGSIGVKKCLEIMLRVRKSKLFNPPVKCTVMVEKLDGAKQWMTLRPDIDSLLCRSGKRK